VVLEADERIPDALVWTTPRESATIAQIAANGAILLLFYLFDWSST
jgi:hypothetical protein